MQRVSGGGKRGGGSGVGGGVPADKDMRGQHTRKICRIQKKRHVGIGPLASGDGGVTSGRVRASPRRRFFRSVSIRKYTHVDLDPFASA